LCTIAAYWAAIKFPTADVRYISFGAPRVGNKAFTFSFVNLVANSYRIVYEADPVPHHPGGGTMYAHVSQAIWIHQGEFLFRVSQILSSPLLVLSLGLALSYYHCTRAVNYDLRQIKVIITLA
jgi:hypothetical protein